MESIQQFATDVFLRKQLILGKKHKPVSLRICLRKLSFFLYVLGGEYKLTWEDRKPVLNISAP